MANRYLMTASGQDTPGIVAGVSGVLFELNCNLEDSAMTRLEGEFAMMVIFTARKLWKTTELEAAFEKLQKKLKLQITLKRLTRAATQARRVAKLEPYILSVYGKDQTGIVHRFATLLAKAQVNITDVETHRASSGKQAIYLLLFELEIPKTASLDGLKRRVKTLAKQLGVTADLQPAETEVL